MLRLRLDEVLVKEQVEGHVISQIRDGSRTSLVLRFGDGPKARFKSFSFDRRLPSFRGRIVRIDLGRWVTDLGPSPYCIRIHDEIARLLSCGIDPRPLLAPPKRLLCIRTTGPSGWMDFKVKVPATCKISAMEVDMTDPRAFASAVRQVLDGADPDTDALVVLRGGGDNVNALDHVDVAMALFDAARTLPTILAVGHSTDRLRIERVLHADLVMDVPADAGRLVADLCKAAQNDERVPASSSPPPGMSSPEERLPATSAEFVELVEPTGIARSLATSVQLAKVVQPVVESRAFVRVAPSRSVPSRLWVALAKWKTALALLGALQLLAVGVMVVRVISAGNPSRAASAPYTAPTSIPANPLSRAAAPDPNSTPLKPVPESGSSKRSPAKPAAAPRIARRASLREAKQSTFMRGLPEVTDMPAETSHASRSVNGRTIIQAPPPDVTIRESPLLRRR
jgi:hypothetical protein